MKIRKKPARKTSTAKHFVMALAGPLRHRQPSEIAGDLRRAKAKGYTGVWIENDYVSTRVDAQEAQRFGNNWRLFNVYEFTLGKQRKRYQNYLREIGAICRRNDLDLYLSFWMPKLTQEMLERSGRRNPKVIGRSCNRHGKTVPSLCTCEGGEGLKLLGDMIEQFFREHPYVRGLKVATEDNMAWICDPDCPNNSHGTSRARHAANMFAAVQKAMLRVRADAHFLLYPWFWRAGYAEEILPRLSGDYYVVTKMEAGSYQQLEEAIPADPLLDSSILSGKPGVVFLDWAKRVGGDRLVDMTPVDTGIDDFFLAGPPYPGRLFRRFRTLTDHGVRRFLDFECGGHGPGSGEETVALFNEHPRLSEEEFLRRLAARMYRSAAAREAAIAGWKAFDLGFGKLPVGLGKTARAGFSGRFGFSWSMCIATPLIPDLLGSDRRDEIHFFSPYNFFDDDLADRFHFHFQRVLKDWQQSAAHLAVAAALDGNSAVAQREAVSARGHVLSVFSALNWCLAPRLAGGEPGIFRDLMKAEMTLTEEFSALLKEHPWLWGNNCWHPHFTPLSQKIDPRMKRARDAFRTKLVVMKDYLGGKRA